VKKSLRQELKDATARLERAMLAGASETTLERLMRDIRRLQEQLGVKTK